eukprot:scaffold19737_cov129-Isochrysis_galbana.AAC.1
MGARSKATRRGIYSRKACPKRTLGEKLGKGNAERGIIPKVAAYATVASHEERGGRRGRRKTGLLLVGLWETTGHWSLQ